MKRLAATVETLTFQTTARSLAAIQRLASSQKCRTTVPIPVLMARGVLMGAMTALTLQLVVRRKLVTNSIATSTTVVSLAVKLAI